MTTIEKCEREVLTLRQAATSLAEKKLEASRELAQLRGQLGSAELDAHLSGGDTKTLRSRIRDLETAIDGYSGAREVLVGRMIRAHEAVNKAKGAELRTQSQELQAELTKRLKTTSELLQQLAEFEGCNWQPAPPPGARVEIVDSSRCVVVTHSELLANRVRGLAQQAATTENLKIQTSGEIEGGNAESLIAATSNPSIIAPVEAEVRAWAEASEAAAITGWEAGPGRNKALQCEIVFRLVWTAGQIDETRSLCACVTVDPMIVGFANEEQRLRAASAA